MRVQLQPIVFGCRQSGPEPTHITLCASCGDKPSCGHLSQTQNSHQSNMGSSIPTASLPLGQFLLDSSLDMQQTPTLDG